MNTNDRFTERAKTALERAQEAAENLGHSYVGTEHLLLGILREDGGQGARVLKRNGMTDDTLTELVARSVGRGSSGASVQGLSQKAKRVIRLAIGDAGRLGHTFVGTEHLLMGILREPDCTAAGIMTGAGLDLNRLYTETLSAFQPGKQEHWGNEAGTGRTAAAGSAPPKTGSRKAGETRLLDQYSRDLTAMARSGQLDPVICRDREIQRVIRILSRRGKNNPVLIGEPGVGKTAVVEGLAQKVALGDVPEDLRGRRVVSLDLTGMLAGTKYRGDFEDRVRNVLREAQHSGDTILFIDEVHTIMGAGAAEGAIDAANILKPALSRGEIQLIGATTLEEYRKHIEKDAALERRFQPVRVEEPGPSESLAMLRGLRRRYEAHHRLTVSDEALEAAVRLSARYLNDRFLPDKAIDLIDEACSAVRMEKLTPPKALKQAEVGLHTLSGEKAEAIRRQDFEGAARLRDRETALRGEVEELRRRWDAGREGSRDTVTAEDVAAVVSEWTGVPVTSLSADEAERLLHMEEVLHRRVVGQEEAVAAVSRAVRRGRVGLKDPRRPIGSFLFLGPTGVGKTELCKALAEAVFGDENAMVRLDMSEFMERHAVSKLIGAPPGYIGYDEGGVLTEKVRRKPYAVVLFDEIEKAHADVFNLLLQTMDDGRLTDSQGRRTDFRNTILVMTSNVGARSLTETRPQLGFDSAEDGELPERRDALQRGRVMEELRRTFKPEFLNRIDETIVFRRLTRAETAQIALGLLRAEAARMLRLGITLEYSAAVTEKLAEKGFDPVFGARPLRRAVQSAIEDAAAALLLDGTLKAGDTAVAEVSESGVVLVKKQTAQHSSPAGTGNAD